MVCAHRRKYGYCSHYQCPFSDETPHGYECVDIVGSFCEIGEDCVLECPYSYKRTDTERKRLAEEMFREYWEKGLL